MFFDVERPVDHAQKRGHFLILRVPVVIAAAVNLQLDWVVSAISRQEEALWRAVVIIEFASILERLSAEITKRRLLLLLESFLIRDVRHLARPTMVRATRS
jgi:hypothetical protein